MSARASLYLLPLLLLHTALAFADDDLPLLEQPEDPNAALIASPWAGSTGELGFASSTGNSNSQSFNARLKGSYTDGDWIHSMDLTGLRSNARYTNVDENGSVHRYSQTTANRYTLSAGSALQLGEHRQLTATLRYEYDDFATYDRLGSFGIGYGTRWLDRENAYLDAQFGPGIRRAHNTELDRQETGLIGRALIDFKYIITRNTQLTNTLLVEAGTYNTFAQNDLALSVSMNDHFALKAGWQARHNTHSADLNKNTDMLTTVNLVYTLR